MLLICDCRDEDAIVGDGGKGDNGVSDSGDDKGDEEALITGTALEELRGVARSCWVN